MSKLYLKKINLTGYKNFSKSTTVELQENLNIVFGPHGCGKSNLLSAITWVLSDNETRNELIDTILFQGNEDIIIKRRLERNGNESFFLNNIQLSDFEYFSKAIVACVN